MNFENSKLLGGIGALIMAFGGAPIALINNFYNANIGGITLIVGIILVLISLANLAKIYQAKTIFTNARAGALIAIIGTIILSVVVSVSPVSTIDRATSSTDRATFLLLLVVLAVFYTISAFFVRRSLKELAICSNTDRFTTAGLWLLIGGISTIMGIGIIILWIAVIGLAVAFFTMSEPKHILSSTELTIDTKTNFCPNCGTSDSSNATFCPNCGKRTTQP